MVDFLGQYYNWIKALHVISVMAWMAGLLYLPRLFVYHAQAGAGSETANTFVIMERKLLKIIMNPAMIAAWIFGLLMIYANPELFKQGWMHVKFTGVLAMTGMHMVYAKWRKALETGENVKPHTFYRIWNEVPAVLMIIIVIMAIVEPF